METPQVFGLNEVVRIVGMSEPSIKFWTAGRRGSALRIRPSVHRATGKGSRNLYSREDVLLFAVARQMRGDGLPSEAIKEVIQLAQDDSGDRKGDFWGGIIVLARVSETNERTAKENPWPEGEWKAQLLPNRQAARACFDSVPGLSIPFFPPGPVLSFYALDLKQLVASVDQAIDEICRVPSEAKENM